jgi:hypothetical protein
MYSKLLSNYIYQLVYFHIVYRLISDDTIRTTNKEKLAYLNWTISSIIKYVNINKIRSEYNGEKNVKQNK